MNKTLEAGLRGYILFDVNGARFLRYNSALAQRKATEGNVEFNGLHIFKGWQCFFVRFNTPMCLPEPSKPNSRRRTDDYYFWGVG
tara:strand:+ start:25931 stop:26185 length:255 start_codon:yes stop_codon:yes gene_type:complete